MPCVNIKDEPLNKVLLLCDECGRSGLERCVKVTEASDTVTEPQISLRSLSGCRFQDYPVTVHVAGAGLVLPVLVVELCRTDKEGLFQFNAVSRLREHY